MFTHKPPKLSVSNYCKKDSLTLQTFKNIMVTFFFNFNSFIIKCRFLYFIYIYLICFIQVFDVDFDILKFYSDFRLFYLPLDVFQILNLLSNNTTVKIGLAKCPSCSRISYRHVLKETFLTVRVRFYICLYVSWILLVLFKLALTSRSDYDRLKFLIRFRSHYSCQTSRFR